MKTPVAFAIPLVLSMALSSVVLCQEDDPTLSPKTKRAAEVRERDAENRKQFADDRDVLVLPGLVAKRQEKRVEVVIESTGSQSLDSAEYLVVHAASSHGYEALFWSHAKPSDIHRALEFIGLRAGASRDPAKLRFWSRGPHLTASIEEEDGTPGVPLETMVFDRNEEEALPERGFIFTGSRKIKTRPDSETTVYAADQYDPYAVISAFNDSLAVLDIGWQISKEQAYQTYQANPEYATEKHSLYTLVLEPGAAGRNVGIRDVTIAIENRETFILKDAKTGEKLIPESTIGAVLTACRKMVRDGSYPYATLRFSDDMKLRDIQPICWAMAMLDNPDAIRIEPPEAGRLYYRSFLPEPRWRDHTNRMSQAWEVHLGYEGEKLTAAMAFYETIWPGDGTDPDYKEHVFPAPTAEAIRKRLDADAEARRSDRRRQPPPVLMIYAPADMTYGKVLAFLGPALKTHKTVHLFLEK